MDNDWFDTKSVNFTLCLYYDLFVYIHSKLNLKTNDSAMFWNNLAKAQDLLNRTLGLHNTNEVISCILNNIQAILSKRWEPLELANHVSIYSGQKLTTPAAYDPKFNKRSFNTSLKFNKKIENCRGCKRRNCDISEHKQYWLKKFS